MSFSWYKIASDIHHFVDYYSQERGSPFSLVLVACWLSELQLLQWYIRVKMDETQSLKENKTCVKDVAPLTSKGLTICHCRGEWINQTTSGFLHSTELQDELGLEVNLERKNSDFPNLQQTNNFLWSIMWNPNIVMIVYVKEVLIRGQKRAMIRPLILSFLMRKWRAHIWVTYLDHTHLCSLKEKQGKKI